VKPKPFLPLVGDQTLFEAAINRAGDRDIFAAPLIVTGKAHLDHVESQLGAAQDAGVVVEPAARNTAAAIALAALRLDPDAVMLVCPSDHHIGDAQAFVKAATQAAALAQEGWLVSFGIAATAPETGFGYVKRGEGIAGSEGYRVDRFVEKPDLERAMQFLSEGSYSWNGGIFAFRAGITCASWRRIAPTLPVRWLWPWRAGMRTGAGSIPMPTCSARCPAIDRLCRDGKDRARRHGPGQHGVERHRQLARPVGGARDRR
jgi:mannose-1-phosphate guanylyltransferase